MIIPYSKRNRVLHIDTLPSGGTVSYYMTTCQVYDPVQDWKLRPLGTRYKIRVANTDNTSTHHYEYSDFTELFTCSDDPDLQWCPLSGSFIPSFLDVLSLIRSTFNDFYTIEVESYEVLVN